MPRLTTHNGMSWNYEVDEGQVEGEVIVFLHGWGGDLHLWNNQAEYFSKDFKVIRIDLPGHGQSRWVAIDLAMIAQDLESILESLECKQINVVGSSLGGLIALKWFDLFPKRFKRMVLVGAFPKFLQSADYQFGLESRQLKKLENQLETDYPEIVNIFFRSLFTRRERETSRFKYLTRFRKNETVPLKEALAEFLNILEKADLRPTLSKLSQSAIPIQILNGTEDYICSKETVNYLKENLPQLGVKFFEGCGHFPFLTQVQEFNETLREFLDAS